MKKIMKNYYLSITAACGYKLEQLDKLYRYGQECYAYAINFQISDMAVLQQKSDADSFGHPWG